MVSKGTGVVLLGIAGVRTTVHADPVVGVDQAGDGIVAAGVGPSVAPKLAIVILVGVDARVGQGQPRSGVSDPAGDAAALRQGEVDVGHHCVAGVQVKHLRIFPIEGLVVILSDILRLCPRAPIPAAASLDAVLSIG